MTKAVPYLRRTIQALSLIFFIVYWLKRENAQAVASAKTIALSMEGPPSSSIPLTS
jgi:hypothetical protein